MPTPEEERKKRGLLEMLASAISDTGQSASRIGKNTASSIANAIGGGFSDVAGRFGQPAEAAPPPAVRPESIAPSEPMGPPDPMDAGPQNSKLGSATLPPRAQSNPPIARMRPGAILPMRGNAQPTDLESGEPSINRLLSQATSYHEKSPNPGLSSTFDLGSLAPLDNIIKEEPQVADVSNVTKDSFATLGGGDLVDSWNEVKTAQKELGSFSDSAGKWWSVALAAMFPQYGSALNLIGNMKSNKYRAAMDKYESAYKQNQPDYMRVDDRIWDPKTRKFITEKTPASGADAYTSYYADTPSGTKVQQVKRGERYEPEYVEPGAPYQGPTLSGAPISDRAEGARYPYFSEGSYTKQRLSEDTTARNEANISSRKDLESIKQANKMVLQGMRRQASMDLVKYRDDLKDYTSDALDAAQSDLENSIDFMAEENSGKKYRMLLERTTRLAEDMKRIKQANRVPAQGALPSVPASSTQRPTGPATRVME